jgi:hypothetical protein
MLGRGGNDLSFFFFKKKKKDKWRAQNDLPLVDQPWRRVDRQEKCREVYARMCIAHCGIHYVKYVRLLKNSTKRIYLFTCITNDPTPEQNVLCTGFISIFIAPTSARDLIRRPRGGSH